MSTRTQSHSVNVSTIETKSMNSSLSASISDVWEKAEFSRFAITPMLLVMVACIGGYAAAITVKESAFQLTLASLSTALVEALILAVAPMRSIIIASTVSLVLSLLVIIF